jgi:hypothetical protein
VRVSPLSVESLVFYLIQVNDVWAYFNTGMQNNKITNPTPTTFPTTGSVLGQITTVAQQAPAPFTKSALPDNVAMTIEVKSSWIETTGLANVDDYITIDATIPTYNPPLTNPTTNSRFSRERNRQSLRWLACTSSAARSVTRKCCGPRSSTSTTRPNRNTRSPQHRAQWARSRRTDLAAGRSPRQAEQIPMPISHE